MLLMWRQVGERLGKNWENTADVLVQIELKNEVSDKLKEQLRQSFVDLMIDGADRTRGTQRYALYEFPPTVKEAGRWAKNKAKEISLWRMLGQKSMKDAKFVGVRRYVDCFGLGRESY